MISLRRSALAAALLTALTLSACSTSSPDAVAALDSVTVSGGDSTTAPTVTIAPQPLKVDETVSKVLTAGEGAELGPQDVATIQAVIVNGSNGNVVNDTWQTGGPTPLDLTTKDLFPAIVKSLPGTKVGSRLLVAAPMKDVFGTTINPASGLTSNDSVVFVIDVLSAATPLAEATGEAVAPKEGLPTITVESGKPAQITIPSGVSAPTSLVVQPLIAGAGATVAAGQTVRVTYTGALWKDGSIFDSSSAHDPSTYEFVVGQGGVISGWDKAVEGQKVGSRLLVVVPPAEGYGDKGKPPAITGDDTLVFVIDILAAL